MDYTVMTDKSVDDAVAAVEDALKARKFGVLWKFDLTQTLKSKGFDYEYPYRVLEVCNPEIAMEVATADQRIGYFLPCKVVVYESKGGQTHIGMTKPTSLFSLVEDSEVVHHAQNVEGILKEAIDAAR